MSQAKRARISSPSSPEQERRSRVPRDHSEIDENSEIDSLIRALLFKDQSKEPFRKVDIANLALKRRKIDPQVWSHMQIKLRESLGFVLVELNDPNLMILVKETRSLPNISNLHSNPSIHNGLLVIVLGAIFMAGGAIEESTLMDMLLGLNVPQDTLVLLPGNIKVNVVDLLNSIWKKQLYLQVIDQPNGKGKTYHWGERAEIEISKRDILNLMARIMDSKPEQWREQYKIAYPEHN